MTVIGLGVDIIDIARVRRLFGTHGDRALGRLCTDAEAAYVRLQHDGAQHLAVRLAAKEAAYKALSGTHEARRIGWREIEVVLSESGIPSLVFHGRAAARARELGTEHAFVSLSHSDSTAIAVVLLQRT